MYIEIVVKLVSSFSRFVTDFRNFYQFVEFCRCFQIVFLLLVLDSNTSSHQQGHAGSITLHQQNSPVLTSGAG